MVNLELEYRRHFLLETRRKPWKIHLGQSFHCDPDLGHYYALKNYENESSLYQRMAQLPTLSFVLPENHRVLEIQQNQTIQVVDVLSCEYIGYITQHIDDKACKNSPF